MEKRHTATIEVGYTFEIGDKAYYLLRDYVNEAEIIDRRVNITNDWKPDVLYMYKTLGSVYTANESKNHLFPSVEELIEYYRGRGGHVILKRNGSIRIIFK